MVNLKPSWLINSSQKDLTATEKSVLAKGSGFAIIPKINKTDFIVPIEAALQLPDAAKQDLEITRVKICDTISKAVQPTRNFSRVEWTAYRNLRDYDSIRILQADKGNAIVLLDKVNYHKKYTT